MRATTRFLFVVFWLQSLNLPAFENKQKKYRAYDRFVSMEMVRMAKSRPSKNQSERSDLPQDYLAI